MGNCKRGLIRMGATRNSSCSIGTLNWKSRVKFWKTHFFGGWGGAVQFVQMGLEKQRAGTGADIRHQSVHSQHSRSVA